MARSMLIPARTEQVHPFKRSEPMPDRVTLPVLPLREIALLPGVSTPIGAGQPAAVRASEPGRLVDLVAGYLEIKPAERQGLLETLSVEERLRRVLVHVQRQIGVLEAQEHIKSQVQEELGERQREMFLREQMKAIKKELGEGEEGGGDLAELRKRFEGIELPEAAKKEVDREFQRLERAGRASREEHGVRPSLEPLPQLPVHKRAHESLDLKQVAQILEQQHFGLDAAHDP